MEIRKEEKMSLLVDIGGAKGRRTLQGKWKVLDLKGESESGGYNCNLNDCKLPFETDSVDAFFCSHTLEHVEPENILPVLKEIRRSLKPNGKIRIVVPDAEIGIKWYLKHSELLSDWNAPSKDNHMPATRMGWLNGWFHTKGKFNKGHKIGFDWELLVVFLRDAGFKKIQRMSFGDHSKVFKGKDYRRYRAYSIFCEVTK